MNRKRIFFFVGTEAEFIKLFPVIMECQRSGNECNIIASGQNDIKKSRIMDFIKLNGKFVELSQEEDIKKNAVGLFTWFIKTKQNAIKIIMKNFSKEELSNVPMVVHGDTVSTLMGALVGRRLRMKVCHVEAGLRSHHLFNPFPEEIDRLLTSLVSKIHFAPGQEAVDNLKHTKGQVVDTVYNTILDSLNFSQEMPIITKGLEDIIKEDYFVFVMHRQENLMNKDFVKQVIQRVEKLVEVRKCVFILHEITKNTLKEMGLMERLSSNSNFILLPRVDYFDFMKLLKVSQFVITDGGSNQEELHYMGKACLIMRKTTERNEGIGQNAIMYQGDVDKILVFGKEYKDFEISSVMADESPSSIVANYLEYLGKYDNESDIS